MKNPLKNSVFCILALLLFSCEKENPAATRIHGVVYNINSSDPVAGAMVIIAGRSDGIYDELDSIETDEMGRFALSYDSRRYRSIYTFQAFSPNHAPWYSKTSSINWPSFVNAGFKGQRDIYIIPRSWLRIRAVKVSNATGLFINPIWDRFPVATKAQDITFLWAAPGNQELILPCFREYGFDSIVGFRNPITYYAPAYDTVDVLVEW